MDPLAQVFAECPDLQRMWNDINRDSMKHHAARAKADPAAHKLSRVFEEGLAYRYWPAGLDGRGRKVRFCWSSHRNVAGYFLAWREVVGKAETKRDQWSARKLKRAAEELARRRQNAFIDKHSQE